MVQVVQVEKVVQVVQVVRIISPDDMHSESILFLWSKPSNYQEKLRCHACDTRRTDGGKQKIKQYSGRPETATIFFGVQKKSSLEFTFVWYLC